MRFLLDENADLRLRPFLTNLEHDVTAIARDYPQALSDRAVLSIAHSEQRILVTNDRDFGALVFDQRQPHAGVLFFRLKDTAYTTKRDRLKYVLTHHGDQLDQYLTITERRVRVRERPSS